MIGDLPQGECILQDRDGQLWIARADPRIMITFQLLDEIVCGRSLPEVTIRHPDSATPSWKGSVIRIEAANRTVLYRLEECLNWCSCWTAEWPD